MTEFRYVPADPAPCPVRFLVAFPGTPQEERFAFYNRLEVGRLRQGIAGPGRLLVADPMVSARHCIITQSRSGRCVIRDVSRNGTRLDGRRLLPSVETEIEIGQRLSFGASVELVLTGETMEREAAAQEASPSVNEDATLMASAPTRVTVLVGDIRDYTVLSRRGATPEVQRSVSRVFEILGEQVARMGGTVKEFQGDAIFAFWEPTDGREPAIHACRAALELDALARRLAEDPGVWAVPDFPLRLDWAMATGPVVIDTVGGASPSALSMIGRPVVLAFRIEKLADDGTGPILACPDTWSAAQDHFEFRDLGSVQPKGFDKPQRVFALSGARAAPEQAGPEQLDTLPG